MRKKMLLVLTLIMTLFTTMSLADVNSVGVQIPKFDVTVNSQIIDTEHSEYPVIVYNDITYFPMTSDYVAGLGLSLEFSSETGLKLSKNDFAGKLEQKFLGANNILGSKGSALLVPFPVMVNGSKIDNDTEEYPVLLYKNITYFPMTWRFAVEEFGWTTSWSSETGFGISSDGSNIEMVNEKSEELFVHFIDVGQADSVYIGYGDFDMVIDGGNNSDGDDVVNYLKAQNVDDIEIMVATHPHEDHIGGLDDVLKAFEVEKIIDSGQAATTKTYLDYMAAAKNENTEFLEDEDIVIDISGDLKVEIIETGDGYSNINDNSVVAKVTYKDVSMLFTGDMEDHIEKTILDRDLKADVLKAGHHGSSTSNSYEFLAKVDPEYIVISAGLNNSYGHPHKETMINFAKFTDNIYGTWESGTIVVSTDGENISVDKEKLSSVGGVNEETTTEEPTGTASESIKITDLDKVAEYIKITNSSNEDIDITGYVIVSVTGNQRFTFPSYILKANSTIKVGDQARNTDVTFHWLDGRGTWNNSNEDIAQLYNKENVLISEYK